MSMNPRLAGVPMPPSMNGGVATPVKNTAAEPRKKDPVKLARERFRRQKRRLAAQQKSLAHLEVLVYEAGQDLQRQLLTQALDLLEKTLFHPAVSQDLQDLLVERCNRILCRFYDI
jgi:hypothetical protein